MSGDYRKISVTLFAALFAGQAAVIAMSPVLAQAASDLHVSTAAAGQLRTITGLAAGATALTLGPRAARIGLRRQLLAASVLLALASLASAAAPSFAALALAQAPVGIAVAILTTAGTLAAAEWVPDALRTRTLSWALIGQPAAWIAGMPLLGVVGEQSWRYGWLVLPLLAAIAAALLVARNGGRVSAPASCARARDVVRDGTLGPWLASELLANAAWAGTLVYAGALYAQLHGTSTAVTGLLLSIVAAGYVAGNLACRRLVRREPRRVLVLLAATLAGADFVFQAAHCGVAARTALFAAAAFVAGARTLVSSAYAVAMPAELRSAATSLRAATMQFGYFLGSSIGGAALALGGYGALGAAMASLLLGAAFLLLPIRHLRQRSLREFSVPVHDHA